jgi:hypothetical protein
MCVDPQKEHTHGFMCGVLFCRYAGNCDAYSPLICVCVCVAWFDLAEHAKQEAVHG